MSSSDRLTRFTLRMIASHIIPGERVCSCGLIPVKAVQVKLNTRTQKARYGGLVQCKSVWACAVCGHIISSGRARELQGAIDNASKQGYSVALATFTLRHGPNSDLRITQLALRKSIRRVLAHRQWANFCRERDIVGVVSSLEVTWGKMGFHPHIHMLIFGRKVRTSKLRDVLSNLYLPALAECGQSALDGIAVKVTFDNSKVGAYVQKQGMTSPKWSLAQEVTMQQVKRSKSASGYTMQDLLLLYWHTREARYADLWKEYYNATKGAKQLFVSPNIKRLFYATSADLTDGDLVDLDELNSSLIAATIDNKLWWCIVQSPDRLAIMNTILSKTESSLDDLAEYIRDLSISLL